MLLTEWQPLLSRNSCRSASFCTCHCWRCAWSEMKNKSKNVELTLHPGLSHKSQVFGTSFESLMVCLKGTNITHVNSPTLQDIKPFAREVQSSRVSKKFYKSYHELGTSRNVTSPKQQQQGKYTLPTMKIPLRVYRMPPRLYWKSSSKLQRLPRAKNRVY
jgi:hypothetical protein